MAAGSFRVAGNCLTFPPWEGLKYENEPDSQPFLHVEKVVRITANMNIFNRPRIVTALVVLVSMLFMQLAVAAYACPAQEISHALEVAKAMAEMPDCSEMDKEQPNLCHAHEQFGNQSLDKPNMPDVASIAPSMLAGSFYVIDLHHQSTPGRAPPPYLAKSTAPPIAIQHCCFRI